MSRSMNGGSCVSIATRLDVAVMPAIGITGGISTGKSTFVNYLRELLPAAKFFDADTTAHELTSTDAATRTAIQRKFGEQVFEENGELNRETLRAIVFAAPEKRRELEEILHPRIRARWSSEAQQFRQTNDFYIADIPLLYETGGERLCDRVVVVACEDSIQLERLMKRTGMNEEAARVIVASQTPIEEKIKRADHVVWNNGPEEALRSQAELLVKSWTTK